MALDKLVDSTQLDSDLTSVADAIRAKSGGSSQLAFPAGFVSEIQAIPSGGGLLPDEYQRVEYIQNADIAYINTKWIRQNTTVVEIETAFLGGQSSPGILIGYTSYPPGWFGISDSNIPTLGGGNNLTGVTYSTKNTYEIAFQDTIVTVTCGANSASRTGQAVSGLDLTIFCALSKVTYLPINPCFAKVYSVKVVDNDTIARLLIPCYNKNTNDIGMYDVITHEFFGNANNTGSFTKGPDVLTDSETLEILLGGADA